MIPDRKICRPAVGENILLPSRAGEIRDNTDSRCTVIRAASGFGKTAVVSALFSEEETPDEEVLWYLVDITDRDPERLIGGLETLIGIGMKEGSLYDRIDRLAEGLDNRTKPVRIIFDDMQELGDDESLSLLLLLLRYTKQTRFMMITNRELPLSLRTMVPKKEAVLFDATQLLLTPEDIAEGILQGAFPGLTETETPDRKLISRICDGFGGWALGVVSALHTFSGMPEQGKKRLKNDPVGFWREVLTTTGLGDVIGGIFSEEIYGEAAHLLRVAALLQDFELDLCRAVTECDNPVGIEGEGAGDEFTDRDFRVVVSIPGVCRPLRDGWYRIGEAFAVYLAEEVKTSEKRTICAAAARWYRDHGDFAQMTSYALRASEEDLLQEALEKNGVSLLTGRVALRQIVGYLEERQTRLSPEAAGVVAQYFYLEGRLDRAEKYLNEADSAFGKENRYGAYRSLYRALSHYEEDEDKYKKQIRSVVFFLKEAGESFPRLNDGDAERIADAMEEKETGEKLRVTTFGRFVARVGQEERELAWRTKKGRELFAYLLDIEGDAVDRRQLMETLWPDEIPENAVAMLHNMIYNIRKELSDYRLEKLIVYENKRYRLCMDELETDSVFWRRLAGYVKKKDVTELARNSEAFLIYPGRYLDDIDNTWAAEKREYYDSIYRTGCELLAEHMCEQGESERAIQLYGNILMTDPYSESTVERLIRLYGERREWDKMKKCYEDFRHVLKQDLGIEPEAAVETAYRSFLAG